MRWRGIPKSIGIVHPLRPPQVTRTRHKFVALLSTLSSRISSSRSTPARSSRSVSQGGWDGRWAEKRDRGGVSGTTPAINTVMTLASLPPPRYPRCYYAKRFAVLCHREYAGILEPSLNPIHRASIRLYRAISSPLFSFFFFEVSKRMAPLFDLIIIIIISRWRRKLVDLINPLPRFDCLWSSILTLGIFVW